MGVHFKEIAIVASLSNILFIQEWATRLNPMNHYYLSIKATAPYVVALMLNVILLSIVFLLGFYVIRRSQKPRIATLARWVFIGVLIIPLNGIRIVAQISLQDVLVYQGPLFNAIAFLFVSLVILVIVRFSRLIAHVATIGLLIVSPFVVITFFQGVKLLISEDVFNEALVEPVYSAEKPSQRVLWIIFDGMDQRFTFSERSAEVNLPELDRLRGQSVYATNAYSPNYFTLSSFPAMLTGRLVSDAKVLSSNDLEVQFSDTAERVRLSQTSTIFSATYAEGYRSAIAGTWYHPFCNIFNDITSCFEYPERENTSFRNNRSVEVFSAMLEQVYSLQPWWILLPEDKRLMFSTEIPRRVASFQKTLVGVERYATDYQLGLVLAHFTVPHTPYLYNVPGDTLENEDAYFANLVIADQVLGAVRASMEKAGTWDDTAIIVSADHNWREAEKFDGVSDERHVPFLLKLRGQREGVKYEPELNTVVTHDLILALLRNEIFDSENATNWLDKHVIPK